jgi:branched-chain amino acid transport system ATP-binding protein
MPLLEVSDLAVNYGQITAVQNLTLHVEEREIVSIIGANGAGKTTTMRAIAGLLPPSNGTVRFAGEDVTKVPAHKRVSQGLSLVPEGRGIFPTMTVEENLHMGAYGRNDKHQIAQDRTRVFDLFPRVYERRHQPGGTLSGGEQQMLAIARALMSQPTMLLLDEPTMGLAPKFIQQIFHIVTEVQEMGVTVLLVEQNAHQALARSDRAYVLETGHVTKTGSGPDLLNDPAIKDAYLGVS